MPARRCGGPFDRHGNLPRLPRRGGFRPPRTDPRERAQIRSL